MSTHYPHAPITEAILDLRVTLPEDANQDSLDLTLNERFRGYPKKEELFEAVGRFAVGPAGGASMQQKPLGWKLASADNKQIAQSRRNGFTFSRLSPYNCWKTFRDEARRLWNVYAEILKPQSLTRLAVRYINRIDIPAESVDLKEYFRTSPEIAPDLPQNLEGYFMQLRLAYPNISGSCLINQTIVPPARPGYVSVVLDIDLFRESDVPQQEKDVWSFFESLHKEKNQIFEACITDSTRKLFYHVNPESAANPATSDPATGG